MKYKSLSTENERLREENKRLLAHIEASPDGVLYLESLAEWKHITCGAAQAMENAK